ncbi:acyl-CoA dehydrogenase family protein [Aquibacillus sediminis]|uniref:acyl-CoA dehydrogenase family protein n=1 Tax=Aquibacillus sediminis TaxID=2574734 RepID=UPI001107AE62|nr:acyl-CoA dehydrogenase family protein [Aquibacillus sediminis]
MVHSFIKKEQQSLFQSSVQLAKQFAQRADTIDETGKFPFENFADLKDANYLSLTVPKKFGGEGLTLYDMLVVQEQIARGDGATGLSLGWHLGIVLELAENNMWEPKTFASMCEKIVNDQALINRAATEPATGSPTRGGMPQTTAVKEGNEWVINGRKTFTSMAPALDYSLVTARIDNTEEKGVFLIDHRQEGIRIEETWNTISMRGTRSDDLVLEHVRVEASALVEDQDTLANNTTPKAWLLHIPACYLGIATAARDYAIKFASEYKPNSLPGPIKEVPEVQRKIGEMELELFKARQMLYGVAARWEDQPDRRVEMAGELGAVKHIVTNSANTIVDLAMRIVGARSLASNNPLQRYYRDIRAGLHNPPMDDIVISSLAKQALVDFNG